MTTANKFAFLLRRGMGLKAKNGQLSMPVFDGDEEWMQILLLGKEQTVMGVLERGIQQVPQECRPPHKMLSRVCVLSQKIATMNRICDEAAVKVGEMLEQEGFRYCILKGQGNALSYNDPSARIPGDIDVWVMADPDKVISFARKARADAFACYHHVEYVKCDGVEVELHYRPAFLNNPIYNSRLQRWFSEEAAAQCKHKVKLPNGAGDVNVPTDGFNRIFQMAHMMNHVVHDGLGVRQLMDYYFLLKKGFTPEEQQRDVELLRRFGLYNMTAAVMYTLRQLFGMPLDKMIVPPDERRGRFLMKEVFEGGNFGRYSTQSKGARTKLQRNMLRLRRDMRLLTMFPSECCSEPMFRLWHFFWRLKHK